MANFIIIIISVTRAAVLGSHSRTHDWSDLAAAVSLLYDT